jgi:hypothetical protein
MRDFVAGYPAYHGPIVLYGRKKHSASKKGRMRKDKPRRSGRWSRLYLET